MAADITDFLDTPSGRRIAYRQSPGRGPGVVFLGGFVSDMMGTKAAHLHAWAQARGQAFLRFDYSGHGESSEAFTDGTIGKWAEDALVAIEMLTEGPQVLVGSSMGGWISLLLARNHTDRVGGLVTIAAAPDFLEDSFWAQSDAAARATLMREGVIEIPSDYDAPYRITRAMIEDGRENMVLRSPLDLPMPTRFLQGTADVDVDVSVAMRLLEHADGPDMRLTLVKGADHRFSDDNCLKLIETAVAEVTERCSA